MEPIPLPPRDIHPRIAEPLAGTEALAELHTRLEDTIAGFQKIVEKAEPGFKLIVADFLALHSEHSRAITGMLAEDGHDPARDGSVFGAVNRGLVTARSWFDDIGSNLTDPLIQAEKHILEAYDEAIAAAELPGRRDALNGMRAAQIALLDRHFSDM